jgi:hypothetical protein
LSAINRPGDDRRDFVFRIGKGPFSGWSKANARLDNRSGVQGWRLHDHRRTVVTDMAETGIQPNIIDAVANHISGHRAGVAGVYNRATSSSEKRSAMATARSSFTYIPQPAMACKPADARLRTPHAVSREEQLDEVPDNIRDYRVQYRSLADYQRCHIIACRY